MVFGRRETDNLASSIDISFDYDFDSNLYLLARNPEADTWTIIVDCEGGARYQPQIETFSAYPGCATHEGETAWLVDYFKAEKVHINRPGQETEVVLHPDSAHK
jgi:hypothetical protein